MPGPAPINTANPGKPLQFSSGAPGSGAQVSGYNSALTDLNKALQLSGQTTQAQQMQLGQQLQQNQANVAQNLQSRGLGNTTISQTMGQAPLQTYNLGMAQVNDLNAQRQMGAYQNLAAASMQGGQAISQMAQPYAQSNYAQGLYGQQQAQANLQQAVAHQNSMGMQPIGQPGQGGQQQMQLPQSPGQQAQQPLYFRPGDYGMGQPQQSADQAALAAQYSYLMGGAGDGGFGGGEGE